MQLLHGKRTNRRTAAAFPLIVISLSQGELSRDRAHTEQFSSPPIQAAAVFAEAEQLNGGKTAEQRRNIMINVKSNLFTFFVCAGCCTIDRRYSSNKSQLQTLLKTKTTPVCLAVTHLHRCFHSVLPADTSCQLTVHSVDVNC